MIFFKFKKEIPIKFDGYSRQLVNFSTFVRFFFYILKKSAIQVLHFI